MPLPAVPRLLVAMTTADCTPFEMVATRPKEAPPVEPMMYVPSVSGVAVHRCLMGGTAIGVDTSSSDTVPPNWPLVSASAVFQVYGPVGVPSLVYTSPTCGEPSTPDW